MNDSRGHNVLQSRIEKQSRSRSECRFCQRVFVKREHCIRHERIHTAERPFSCDQCGKPFSRQDTLQRHYRSHTSAATELVAHQLEVTPSDSSQQSMPSAQHDPRNNTPSLPSNTERSPVSDGTVLPTNWLNVPEYQLLETSDLDFLNLFLDAPTSIAHLHQPIANPPDVFYSLPVDDHLTPCEEELPDISRRWFSHVEAPLPKRNSQFPRSRNFSRTWQDVDDGYQEIIQGQLEGQAPEKIAMPSAPFFNRCIHLFIEKFSGILPIIHLPTLQPTEENSWLLVAMCSIGSQLIGTTDASALGERMFLNLHRTILASWPSFFTYKFDNLIVMQTSLIGQIFSMLSAQSSYLWTAQAFHGTLIICFRNTMRALQLSAQTSESTAGSITGSPASSSVLQRVLRRIEYGLHILDAELSLLCHQSPLFKPDERGRLIVESDSEFCLPDPSISGNTNDESFRIPHELRDPTFSECAILSDLLASIAEKRVRSDFQEGPNLAEGQENLSRWYSDVSPHVRLTGTMHLECLWHSGWLAVLCDIDKLEIAFGRDGSPCETDVGQAIQQNIKTWANSVQAQQAVIHVYMMQKALCSISVLEWPAIHIPRCAFHAGLICCGIAKFSVPGKSLCIEKHDWEQCEGVRLLMSAKKLSLPDWRSLEHNYNAPEMIEKQVYLIISLLRRLGPWGLSNNLANTLEAIISSNY